MSITFPVSRGLDIAAEKVKQSARIQGTQKAPSCGRAEAWWCEHSVCSTMMPPCEPPGGCLGFFAAVQGFFNAICAWLRDMAFKQGTEQARLLYPLYEEAGSFHSESEQTSGQMATTANRHGMNSTHNEHVILYPVMDRQFVFIAVSDTVAVICKGGGAL